MRIWSFAFLAAWVAFQGHAASGEVSDLEAVRQRYREYLAAGVPGQQGLARQLQAAAAVSAVKPERDGALMYSLARHWVHHKTTASKAAFVRLFRLAQDAGYGPGGKKVGGYGGRDYLKALGLMVSELDAAEREACAAFLFTNSRMDHYLTWDPSHPGGFNTDYLYCDLFGAVGGILYFGDDATCVRNLQLFRQWWDIILKPSPGTRDFIKVDGTAFHHWTHYNAYMYAFNPAVDFLHMLRGTSFQIQQTSYLRLRNAVYAMLLMCNGRSYAPTLAGRHPFQTALPVSGQTVRKLAELGGEVLGHEGPDPFMAKAYRRVWPENSALAGFEPEPFPTGFWQFNTSPIGIFRQSGWVATLKGMNRSFWGAEIYPTANRYGRYQGYGVLEILYRGGLTASGFDAAGWNWNHPNGGTTVVLPWDKLIANVRRVDVSSRRDFAGALAAGLRPDGLNGIEGECGLYGLDFQEQAAPWGAANFHADFVFKKSDFCFDGYIIRLGSGISNADSAHPTVTTLFQSVLPRSDTPMVLQDETVSAFPYQTSFDGDTVVTLLDPSGTGYLLPPGQDILRVVRRLQRSPDARGNGEETSGRFALAWLDHGTAPRGAGYEMVVVPDTNPQALSRLADEMREGTLYEVLQKNDTAHILYYRPYASTGLVVFEAAEDLPGPVSAVDAQCLIMVCERQDALRVTVVNPVLGLEPRSEQPAVPKTLRLRVRGVWRRSESRVFRIEQGEGFTDLVVETRDGLPQETVLYP